MRWSAKGFGVIWAGDNNIKMSTLPVIQPQAKRSRAEYLRFPTVGEEGGLRQSLEQQTHNAVNNRNYLYIDFQAGGICGLTEIGFFSCSRLRARERRRNRLATAESEGFSNFPGSVLPPIRCTSTSRRSSCT